MKRFFTAVALCAGLAGGSGVALAVDHFGAIALSPSTGAAGWSANYPTEFAAEVAARGFCGQPDCVAEMWFNNTCAAIAEGSNNLAGWSWNASEADAAYDAWEECVATGAANCHVVGQVCSKG
jgi:hypothetical protein